jgi:hypothetical protein
VSQSLPSSQNRTHGLVVGDDTRGNATDEVGVDVNLSLDEVNPLLNESSVLLGGTEEVGVGSLAGN